MADRDHTSLTSRSITDTSRGGPEYPQSHRWRLFLLTALAMIAFAGNSILCRLALRQGEIDAASFTAIRIISGAMLLWLVLKAQARGSSGSWASALALFSYVVAFSFAYISLPAGTGALLLFAAVQATMIGTGLARGERLHFWQWFGAVIAFGGLVLLLLPGISAPSLVGSFLMLAAGIAWGVYSLRGKRAADPVAATAGNFIRAVPIAIVLGLVCLRSITISPAGVVYAVASGAITSALGYIIWYSVLPSLKATTAATVQLSAPVLVALGGVFLLGESMTARILLASVIVLGGIALVLLQPRML